MISNIQRIWIYSLSLIVIVIILGLNLNIGAKARVHDSRLLQQVRSFSYAAERFRQEHLRYPAGNLDLRNDVLLSDKGFAAGDTIYYRGAMRSGRPVVYHGKDDSYTISFTLRHTWPAQGLYRKQCQVKEFFTLKCGEQE